MPDTATKGVKMKTKPVKKELSDVYTILPDGTRTNADLMADLLSNPLPEKRSDRRDRIALYMRELCLTKEEARNFV